VWVAIAAPAAADPSIAFDDAIHRAIANNPNERVAMADIARAQALLAQATASLMPQINVLGMYTRLEGARFIAGRLAFAADTLAADVTLTSPIIDPSAVANRTRSADQLGVAAADAASVARDVALATARTYFAAY